MVRPVGDPFVRTAKGDVAWEYRVQYRETAFNLVLIIGDAPKGGGKPKDQRLSALRECVRALAPSMESGDQARAVSRSTHRSLA